ncbi:hypothetical protein GNI_016290 [Gregarina niphandrodes]|uniref:Uncharacterized protein n=1 Tax=Gregarina niphandrodes TaxID=110365 RepID=A0A023BC88_GRENI|nr:hypothetical protein GNI_016290 [Gregarina niphandrodes]EZG82588.1 hypothetical protein GNI_016290 [Gregarina niphandrodes]|eukprot:XP_011128982.1 hypothetical protein GNI_016290 [Gregarina niphandrodes]
MSKREYWTDAVSRAYYKYATVDEVSLIRFLADRIVPATADLRYATLSEAGRRNVETYFSEVAPKVYDDCSLYVHAWYKQVHAFKTEDLAKLNNVKRRNSVVTRDWQAGGVVRQE